MAADTVTLEFLASFGEAWNRHDLEALMAHMADGCSFVPSVGSDPVAGGYHGSDEVKRGYQAFLDAMPDGRFEALGNFVAGNRGVSEWIFSGTKPDGTKVRARGCDIFTFKDGKILVKNSFRKQQP